MKNIAWKITKTYKQICKFADDECSNEDNVVIGDFLLTGNRCSGEETQCLRLDLEKEHDYDDEHVYMCAKKKELEGSGESKSFAKINLYNLKLKKKVLKRVYLTCKTLKAHL